MQEILELKHSLENERPVSWRDFPDIDIYMDQVLTYMERQHINDQLTSAMVNNYIKSGVLPRASGKKYGKEHLAYLTAICMLKQVISVSDTDILLKAELQKSDIEDFYANYCGLLDLSLHDAAASVPEEMDLQQLSSAALKLAVASYAQKIACQRLINIMLQKNGEYNKKETVKKNQEKKQEKKQSKNS